MENLINWKGLSGFLTGSDFKIRKSYIPIKNEQRVNELLKILKHWSKGEKLYTEDEIKKKLSKIDLFAIYCEKSL